MLDIPDISAGGDCTICQASYDNSVGASVNYYSTNLRKTGCVKPTQYQVTSGDVNNILSMSCLKDQMPPMEFSGGTFTINTPWTYVSEDSNPSEYILAVPQNCPTNVNGLDPIPKLSQSSIPKTMTNVTTKQAFSGVVKVLDLKYPCSRCMFATTPFVQQQCHDRGYWEGFGVVNDFVSTSVDLFILLRIASEEAAESFEWEQTHWVPGRPSPNGSFGSQPRFIVAINTAGLRTLDFTSRVTVVEHTWGQNDGLSLRPVMENSARMCIA